MKAKRLPNTDFYLRLFVRLRLTLLPAQVNSLTLTPHAAP